MRALDYRKTSDRNRSEVLFLSLPPIKSPIKNNLLIFDRCLRYKGGIMPTIKITGYKNGRISAVKDGDDATLEGNLVVGDSDTDSIVINADFDSDLIPDDHNTYDIGSSTKQWKHIYAKIVSAAAFEGDGSGLTGIVTVGGSDGQIQFNSGGELDGAGHFHYKSGKIGIGDWHNTTPSYFFEVKGNTGGGQNGGIVQIKDYGGTPTLILNRVNGNIENSSGVSNGDVLGQIGFQGYNSFSSGSSQTGAKILATVDGTPSNSGSDMPAQLEFHTTPDESNTPLNRLTIKSDGNVGIGTSSPSFLLDVSGGGARVTHNSGALFGLALDIYNYNAVQGGMLLGELRFGNTAKQNAASISSYAHYDWASTPSYETSSYLSFQTTANNSNSLTEQMRIEGDKVDISVPTDMSQRLLVEDYIKVHSDTGYVKVSAVSSGFESKMGIETIETGTVYANALITNDDHGSGTPSLLMMLGYSSTNNAIEVNSTGQSVPFQYVDSWDQIPFKVTHLGRCNLGTLNGDPEYSNWDSLTNGGNGVYMEGSDSDQAAVVIVNRSTSTDSDGLIILIGEGTYQNSHGTYDFPTSTNSFVKFAAKKKPYNSQNGDPSEVPTLIGKIRGDGVGGVKYDESFTGLHASVIETSELNWAKCGMIVESTGKIWHQSTEENISTALPKMRVSSSPKSKTVFGVIAEKSGGFDGYVAAAGVSETETHIEVNSIGEGKIWVSDIGGNIENGDYITSSEIGGYGMLQDDDLLHNYTVAKCTEEIDWDSVTDTIDHNGQTQKIYLSACTYHCG